MKGLTLGAVVVVGLCLLALPAVGQRLHYGRHSWTGVSGLPSPTTDVILTPEEAQAADGSTVLFGRGMTGLSLYMNNDTPVAAQLGYRRIAKRNQTGLRRHALWHTGGSTDRVYFGGLRAGSKQIWAGTAVETSYVTGINVCTSRTGTTAADTIQGFRLFLSNHVRGTTLERVGVAEAVQTPQCARWHDRQNCPRGSIATGIRVHHSGSRARGLALRCTELDGQD